MGSFTLTLWQIQRHSSKSFDWWDQLILAQKTVMGNSVAGDGHFRMSKKSGKDKKSSKSHSWIPKVTQADVIASF